MTAKLISIASWRPCLSLGVAFLLGGTCFAQGRLQEFLGVKNWHGTVTLTGSNSGTSEGGPFSDVWQASLGVSFALELPTKVPMSQSWTGVFRGTASIDSTDTTDLGSCDQTISLVDQGAIGVGKAFTLHLQGPNQYSFFPSDYTTGGATSTTTNTCSPGVITSTGTTSWAPAFGATLQDLPAKGFALRGSEIVAYPAPVQPFSESFGGAPAIINVRIQWDLEPGLLPPHIIITKRLKRRPATGDIVVTVSVTNNGGLVAENTQITVAKIGSTSSTSIPLTLGDIDPLASATGVLLFPGSAGVTGATATLMVAGTFTGGSFTGTSTVTLP